MKKTCIIVSPYFPPSTLAGVHRARHLVKHLPAAGWTPIVLCIYEEYHEERLDPSLAELVPVCADIVKVPAISPRITRFFGLGDIGLRGYLQLRHCLFTLLKSRPVDAVLITGSPYYPMLLAPEIKRRFGVPVVLDFQDPWVSTWGATQSRLSKVGMSHTLAATLEPYALRGAQFVTSVSDTQNTQMADHYPWFDLTRMAAIPIGCDPQDYDALRRMSETPSILDHGFINFSYVGTFLPRAVPLMEVLFRAIARLVEVEPQIANRLRFNFIGTSNQPNEFRLKRVEPLAEAAGILNIVSEVPQRIPYLDALGTLIQSDVILMIGSDEPHYTASKIYPGLMSQRRYFSLFHSLSSAHAILSKAGGGIALSFGSMPELKGLETEICDGLRRLALEPASMKPADPAVYAPYEAASIARRFANVFDTVLAA